MDNAGGGTRESGHQLSNLRRPLSCQYGDRFIPSRSGMDMGLAHYLLTGPREQTRRYMSSDHNMSNYQKCLFQTLFNNRSRILAFSNNTTCPSDDQFSSRPTCSSAKPKPKPKLKIQSAARVLNAPGLVANFLLNLLDWSSNNVLSVAIGNTVYLWSGSTRSVSELTTVGAEVGPVTSVSWAPDGKHIAVGLNNSDIQFWDSSNCLLLRTLKGVHRTRVGSLAWNASSILTTGGMDGKVVDNDMRVQSNMVQSYQGHWQEVCGLKWSASGQKLASGGNDNLVYIWDRSMASMRNQHQWIHRFEGHVGAVKALAWCPFRSNMLASGGGGCDDKIMFWNIETGSCLNSIDIGSPVSGLLWSKNDRELLSSHSFEDNQLVLWNYPSMDRIAELKGHTSQVLSMSQSPNGCRVASMSEDETVRIWNAFSNPGALTRAARTGLNNFRQISRNGGDNKGVELAEDGGYNRYIDAQLSDNRSSNIKKLGKLYRPTEQKWQKNPAIKY